ncbi:MAG: hypothetical protein JKY29_01550 [Gammaproteobacteria bacterium]|nr:hypothetical protein [Gammaproteobacteria bacterium]
MFRHCIALLLALAMLPAFSADDPDIRELMTAEEFAASGLSSLSNEEFDVVNRWLMRYSSQTVVEVSSASPAVKETDSYTIRSRIDGEFTGWNGPTRFPLKNGQVWETKSTRRYSYSGTNPEVEITRNWIGSYRLRLLDTDKSINVKRIR